MAHVLPVFFKCMTQVLAVVLRFMAYIWTHTGFRPRDLKSTTLTTRPHRPLNLKEPRLIHRPWILKPRLILGSCI
jgi:hypothetical protein